MYVCPDRLHCLSLWYKIHESHEKGPDREAGGGWVWKGGQQGRGEGCGAWAARWLTVPRAGTACWHRAGARPQAAFLARGREGWRDSRMRATSASWELGLFCLSSLITLTGCSSLSFIRLCDCVMFGLALILDVKLVGLQRDEVRWTVSYRVLLLDVSGM